MERCYFDKEFEMSENSMYAMKSVTYIIKDR